ncbi:MAG TPA: AzlD domain-containing protein [Afifellaceae bacterium]|nr:AzlD domain-containing protein [Afifellaceae bacterium]
MSASLTSYALIVALGLVTFATRIGGDLVLSRFRRLDPRIEAALDAVPAAVITALVAPMALVTGPDETLAAAVTAAAALRLPMLAALAIGISTVAGLRAIGF